MCLRETCKKGSQERKEQKCFKKKKYDSKSFISNNENYKK